MSDQPSGQPRGPTPRRNPFVTALLILIGIVLLLPGLCSLIFSSVILTEGGLKELLNSLPFLLVCFLIGFGGVALIVFAIRR
jgi:hypothetical protein